MQQKMTAKFGLNNNQSFIHRFNTQQTENFNRSQIKYTNNQSHMNLSQLEGPKKTLINTIEQHRIASANDTVYNCSICDRLRAICPYKSYKTYSYCQKCQQNEPAKAFKDMNQTLADTRGYSFSKGYNNLSHRIDGGIRNMKEVDKVRFVQTNNVYPLNAPYLSRQKTKKTYLSISNRQQRPRSTMTYHEASHQTVPMNQHHIITQPIISRSPKVQEVIFYPVIHNKFVYKSATKPSQTINMGKTQEVKRSRYQSQHTGKRRQKDVEKVVSDFLNSTKPDQILTPVQFKKLADSIYRENNPNLQD